MNAPYAYRISLGGNRDAIIPRRCRGLRYVAPTGHDALAHAIIPRRCRGLRYVAPSGHNPLAHGIAMGNVNANEGASLSISPWQRHGKWNERIAFPRRHLMPSSHDVVVGYVMLPLRGMIH